MSHRFCVPSLSALLLTATLATAAAAQTPHPSFDVKVTGQVSRVRGARVIMSDKARHFIMFDDPSFLFAALDPFLAGR